MIITTYYMTRLDGVKLYQTYSDKNVCIANQYGYIYEDVVEPENSGNFYQETTIPVTAAENPPEADMVLANLFGEEKVPFVKVHSDKIRAILDILSQKLTDEEISGAPFLIPQWKPDMFLQSGDRVIYNDHIYRAIGAFNTVEGQTPDNSHEWYDFVK